MENTLNSQLTTNFSICLNKTSTRHATFLLLYQVCCLVCQGGRSNICCDWCIVHLVCVCGVQYYPTTTRGAAAHFFLLHENEVTAVAVTYVLVRSRLRVLQYYYCCCCIDSRARRMLHCFDYYCTTTVLLNCDYYYRLYEYVLVPTADGSSS